MKYWYLKGGDVLGPITPEEIVKDSDFSLDSLVCPEEESENEASWKSAQDYMDDFGPAIGTKGAKEPEAAPVKEPKQPKPQEPVKEDIKESTLTSRTITPDNAAADFAAMAAQAENVSPEETIHTMSPFTATLQDNLLDEMPAEPLLAPKDQKDNKDDTLAEPSKEAKQAEQKLKDTLKKQEAQEQQVPEAIFTEKSIASAEEVFAETNPAQTFNEADFKIEEQAKPKPAPKPEAAQSAAANDLDGDSPATLTGSGVFITQGEEEVPPVKKAAVPKASDNSVFSSMDEESPELPKEEADAFPFAQNEIFTNEPEPASNYNNVLKSKKPTQLPDHSAASKHNISTAIETFKSGEVLPTTNGKIISMSNMEKPPKPKHDTILILTAIMFLFVGVAVFMTLFYNPAAPQDPQQDTQPQQAMQPLAQEEGYTPPSSEGALQAPEGTPQAPAIPAASLSPDMARYPNLSMRGDSVVETNEKATAENMVKNYLLDSRRGTIEQYLAKTYKDYYSTSWTANLLVGDNYVVDFRALQRPSREPVAYQFRVDIKKGEIIGMNDISLNLLYRK